jgi:hypothetical protein
MKPKDSRLNISSEQDMWQFFRTLPQLLREGPIILCQMWKSVRLGAAGCGRGSGWERQDVEERWVFRGQMWKRVPN